MRSSLSFCMWTRLVTGALMLRSTYRTELTLLQIGTFVQQEGTAIYLLKPPLSLSLLTHFCDLCVTLFTGSVCDLLVCLGHSCVYWLCGSVTVQFGHTNTSVFPVSQLLAVCKACPYYVGVMEFLKPSQRQPGRLRFKATNIESNYSVSDFCIYIDLVIY